MTIPKISFYAVAVFFLFQNSLFSQSGFKKNDIEYNLAIDALLDSLDANFKDIDKTLGFARKAYDLSAKSDNEKGKAISQFYLGRYWYYKNDFDSASYLLTNALLHLTKNKREYPKTYLRTNYYLGTIEYFLGDNNKALYYYGKGLIFSEEINDPDWKVNFLSQIGGCYIQLENFNTAFDIFSKAAVICDSLGNSRLLANVYLQIANIETELNEFDSSLVYFEKANPLIELDNNLPNRSVYHTNLGHLYGKMKKYDNSLQNFKTALDLDKEMDDSYGIAQDLCNIGDIYKDMGNYDSAEYYLTRSLHLATEIDYPEVQTIDYYNLGELQQKNHNFAGAVSYAKKSLSVAKKAKLTGQILDACKLLYTNLANLGQYNQAFDWELYYQQIQDSLVKLEKKRVKESLMTKFQREKELEVYKEKNRYEKSLRKYLLLIIAMGLLLIIFLYLLYYSKNKTAKKLQKQRDYFNTLRENSEDIVFVINKKCELAYISPSYERKTGRKIPDRLNKKASDFIHPDDVPVLKELLKKAGDIKQVKHFEFRLKSKEGKWLYVAASGKNCLDNPDINGFIINVWDITDRKADEQKLLESEKSYRALFNNASDAIFVHTADGTILDINKDVEDMFGYSKDEIVGKKPIFLGAPGMNDVEILLTNVRNAFSGSPTQFEFWAKRKNGEVFPMLVRVNNSRFFGKDVLITFAIDISESKKAEEKIRKSEEKFRRIFEAFPDIYFKSDKNGVIVEVSPSVEKVAGFKREELIGKDSKLFYKNDTEWDRIGQLLAENKVINDVDVKIKSKSGKNIHCSLSASLIFDKKGNFLGLDGVIRDITERDRIKRLLEKSKKELTEANKAKEILLSVIGHDIKGAIGTNKAMTDLIIKEGHNIPGEKLYEIVESIKPAIDSTYNMVENLATWSKMQRHKLETVLKPGYIKPVIDEVFSLYSYHASTKEIQLNLAGDNMLTAIFDTNTLNVIIRNLVSNSIKFTEKGGRVTVTLTETDDFAVITVEDTGIGIPQEIIDKLLNNDDTIFSSFGTENEKGTGLGLSLAMDFVKLNKGRMEIKNKNENGTIISVFLNKIEV